MPGTSRLASGWLRGRPDSCVAGAGVGIVPNSGVRGADPDPGMITHAQAEAGLWRWRWAIREAATQAEDPLSSGLLPAPVGGSGGVCGSPCTSSWSCSPRQRTQLRMRLLTSTDQGDPSRFSAGCLVKVVYLAPVSSRRLTAARRLDDWRTVCGFVPAGEQLCGRITSMRKANQVLGLPVCCREVDLG